MTSHRFIRTGRFLAALSLLAIALVLPLAGSAVADHCHDECRTSYARFGTFTSDGVVLQTQAGTQTIDLPRDTAGRIAVSTTGEVSVPVEYRCVEAYHVYVVKESQTPTGLVFGGVVYDQWVYPACGSGVDVHDVPIGTDAGTYHFHLDWWGCNGDAGSDYREIRIVDPPLPIPAV